MYGLYDECCDGIGVRRGCGLTAYRDTSSQREVRRDEVCAVAVQECHAGHCGAAESSRRPIDSPGPVGRGTWPARIPEAARITEAARIPAPAAGIPSPAAIPAPAAGIPTPAGISAPAKPPAAATLPAEGDGAE